MTFTFEELCEIIATSRGLSADFWKEDPIYIRFGARKSTSDTLPYSSVSGPTVALDVDEEKQVIGIEFAPL